MEKFLYDNSRTEILEGRSQNSSNGAKTRVVTSHNTVSAIGPNATNLKIGIDILTETLWDTAVQRAHETMDAKRLEDRKAGKFPNDLKSAYRVTEKHVVGAYEKLVQGVDLNARMLAYRGSFQQKI